MADWADSRLPVFLEAPPDPPAPDPIQVDEHTTPRQLVLRTMFGNPSRTLPGSALIIGHQVGEALVPVVMGLAIDRGIATGDWPATVRWVLVLAAVFAFLSFSFRFGSRIGFLGMQTVQHRLRTQVTDRIIDPRGLSGGHTPGVLLSIATADVQRLAMTIALTLYPVGELAAIVFCGVVLLSISWPLGLLVLLGAPAMLWCLDKAGNTLRARSEAEQREAGEAAGAAADLVAGFRVIKGVHAEPEADRRYRSASGRALAAVIRARRSQGAYVGAMEAVSAVFIVLVGVLAGIEAVNGALTVGQLITVVGVTQVAMGPLSQLGSNFGKFWVAGHASAKRVLMVLQAPYVREEGTGTAPHGDPTPVRLTGVRSGTGTVDLGFPGRGTTAVVCDADTAADATALLSRARAAGGAAAHAGDTDLYSLTENAALAAVRVAPHTSTLFEGTVAENVAVAADGADDRVAAALLAAACDDVIEVLPQGLQTSVGEAGRLLSGGQRQRVSLARALAADTATLVLVDPTSAVDSVTEATIAERLGGLRADRATVIFTHSPALIAAADTVLTVSGAEVTVAARGAADPIEVIR
ncbi:ABC transporter ATP-binding protein [Nocardiopsis tropica]